MFFRRGAPKAKTSEFERELLEHVDSMYGMALRLTRDAAAAEDLVQDTFVKAIRFQESYEAGTNARAWLLKILTNTFINRYRRSVREHDVLEADETTPVGESFVSAGTMRNLMEPESAALAPIVAKEIRAALDRLSPEHRMIVVLADVEEMSYREIADIIGCPIGTVMSRLFRARRALQADLVDHARDLGIITDEVETGSEQENAVSLDAYRARKVAGGDA